MQPEIIQKKTAFPFLQGGGEMGELARNFSWSNTPLGTPDHWPQNLRTSVSILLNSQFPMFVWWGDELITIYNDSYKIIAGDKHPGLLGKSGKEGWAEIWDDLAPLVAKVFSGVSTWSDDLLLYVNRHGFAEPAYFTFSYSPIFDDTGAVNGLFCAVVETTEKVVSKKKLEESREDLAFAIEAAELATWAYDPITNRFIADERYKEWFGLMGQEATYDTLSLNLIAEEDRQKVANAIVQAQDPSSDGRYEIQYTIRPKNRPERILRAKGKAWFTEEGVAYRLTGTLQDVTKQEESRKLVEESERNLRNTILQAPVAMCILKGRDNVIEIANERIIELWGVKGRDVIGESIFAAIPELADQGFETLLSQVYTTGETYKAFGITLTAADNQGGLHVIYIDFVYEAYRETDGSISGIIVVASDVTVQVSARKTVEESEQKVHALFQSAPFPIATYIGREMRIEMANPSLIEIWGKGPDIIGKLYAEVLPELDPEIYKQLEEVYTTGKAYHARNRRVDLVVDGKIKPYYFNYSFTPLFSTEGNVYGVMNTGADVTDLNVAKLQLEESEARFRTLVEQAPLPIAMTRGRDMVFEIINESMLHLIDRTDVLNKPIAEVLPELKEQLVENILYKVWDSGETFRGFEVPAKLNTGTQQRQSFFNILYSPVMENGIVSKIIHVAIDVTEQVLARKKIEESSAELQLAIEVAELGTFRVDLLHNEAVYSKRVMDWLNVTEQGLSLDLLLNSIHPDDRARCLIAIENASNPGNDGRIDLTFRAMHPETNTVQHLRTFTKIEFNNEGQAYLIVGVIQDITQQVVYQEHLKESEAELQRRVEERTKELAAAISELKRSNSQLEEFAHAASHDLKEPIRKIHFFTDRLKNQLGDKLTPQDLQMFGRVEHASRRMNSLIDDLLLYSHVSQKPHEKERIDLNDKIRRLLEDLELDIEEKGAIVTAGKLPVVQGYKRQLQQLFHNLLTNALKYSRQGVTPQIEITADMVEGVQDDLVPGKTYHLISVSDNGIGFEQEQAEKIFQMFQRLHGKNEYEGTGVGLSIAKKVAENHDGKITADGKPGKGATFKLYLPVEAN